MNNSEDRNSGVNAARGILLGTLFVIPFWVVVFGIVVFFLVR